MQVGVAKVCITPPVGTWQGGYGARTRPAEGVHDDLYARALVLEGDGEQSRCAVVSADVVSLPHEIANAARRRAEALSGIPAARIAICCTHTHGGPLTRPFAAQGSNSPAPDDDYIRTLEKHLAGAVAAAARTLRPVRASLGRGEARFNVNRRLRTPEGTLMRPNPEGVIDHEVLAIRLDAVDPAGTTAAPPSSAGAAAVPPSTPPVAMLFRYTCHATSKGADNYEFTADYPGAAAAFVEQAYGGQTIALFLQGCTGDIRPHFVNESGAFRGATWDEVARLGREVGAAAVSAAERALAGADGADGADGAAGAAGAAGVLAFAGKTELLPYAPMPSEVELQRTLDAGRWPDGAAVTKADHEWARRIREAAASGTLPRGSDAEVQVLRLGGVWLVLLPGEVFVEIGWRVREAVAQAAGVAPALVVVAAYANGNVGYVPTGAAIPHGGYEVTVHRGQGTTGYTAEAEQVLARMAAELAVTLR